MNDLAQLLHDTMRRRHMTPQTVADKTGIRTPRIRVFAEDGSSGPISPTRSELTELADALGLPRPLVLHAAGLTPVGSPA
ncbi:UNVERIFIED_CONTAM: hypothetical protein RKD43_006621 [Streptomyces graminofaciens]